MRVPEALALGVLQGATELLPVSSSGHATLVPWLLGRPRTTLSPASAKALDVALHAGSAPVMLRRPATPPVVLAASLAPAAVTGLAFEARIERTCGTPAGIAAGLAAGGVAMLWADVRGGARPLPSVTVGDGLALGIGQAAALVPGVSRSGATLAAARARGFSRPAAWTLSRDAAMPVIAGAAVLKGLRAIREAPPAAPTLAGALGAYASARVAAHVVPPAPALWPFALYRLALAAVTARRLRRG